MKGVFSWEDVLLQRYQSKAITPFLLLLLSIPHIEYTYLTDLKTGNKPPPLPHHQTIAFSSPQSQSQLLTRLSPELRLMIWGFVLADQRIHIIQCNKRLGHVVCPCALEQKAKRSSPSPSPERHTRPSSTCEICHGTGISQPAKEADLARWNKVKLLSLALTCRQMYERFFYPSTPTLLVYLYCTIHVHVTSQPATPSPRLIPEKAKATYPNHPNSNKTQIPRINPHALHPPNPRIQ